VHGKAGLGAEPGHPGGLGDELGRGQRPAAGQAEQRGGQPDDRCVPSAILQARKSPPGRRLGGLFGGSYWGSSSRTVAAWAPFGPAVTSNSTAWPSSSER
jgi:hypothetical protein